VPVDSDPHPDSPDDADAVPTDQESQDAQETPRGGDTPDAAGAPETRDANTGTGTDANSPDIRHLQIAEDARYRQVVDAAYQVAARDAWARAVPESRAAWEDHKKRYPEESRAAPLTQPDGSWVAEGGRRLSPEQNAEVSKCCADLRHEAEKVILPAMRRIEAADPERHLAGLENMLKGEDRLKEKIADELFAKRAMTAREALNEVADPVRFTLSYPSERYADGVLADVDLIKAEGFELIKLKNLWTDNQYKGINSQWSRPETGLRFEMQFHTTESLEAKDLTHEAYERIRAVDTSRAERPELRAFRRQVNAPLVTPPGIAAIKDFPEKDNG
jgi:hypothetical protein